MENKIELDDKSCLCVELKKVKLSALTWKYFTQKCEFLEFICELTHSEKFLNLK